MPECNPPVANTFCSVNIHCILSTKERVPMLNPKRREWLWPFLGGGLWRFQCECLPIARNHSLHPKSARTPSDPNFSPGIPSVAEAASAQFRRQISLGLITGLIMTSAVPSETGSFCIATQASYLATIMLSLRDKIHSPAEALLKLTLMGASLPAPPERLGPTRNKGLLVSPLLQRFLRRSTRRASGWHWSTNRRRPNWRKSPRFWRRSSSHNC